MGVTHGIRRRETATTEALISRTVELLVRGGAASWCAYLAAAGPRAWRVCAVAGDGAPAVGTVWTAAQIERLVAGGERRSAPHARNGAGDTRPVIRLRSVPALSGAVAGGQESQKGRVEPAGLLCVAPPHESALAETLDAWLDALDAVLRESARSQRHLQVSVQPAGAGAGPAPGAGLLAREEVCRRLATEVARATRFGGELSVLLFEFDAAGPPAPGGELNQGARRGVAAPAGATRPVQPAQPDAPHRGRDAALAGAVATGGLALLRHLRQIDCAGVYGERSFLVLLPETNAEQSLAAARRLAQLVRAAVSPPVASGVEAPAVALWVGASTFPVPARTADQLLAQAEAALAAVRAGGGAWLGHALERLTDAAAGGFRCVCRQCGAVFQVLDRAQQRARRYCSTTCYTNARRARAATRDDAIRQMRRQGASLREIARRYGLTAERVRQICDAGSVGPRAARAS